MKSYSITVQDMFEAKEHQIKMEKRRCGAKTQRACNPNRDLVAYIGEKTFEKYLIENNIKYEKHKDDTANTGDTYDFKVGDCLVDVKASERFYNGIYLNEWQKEKATKNKTLLVGVYVRLKERVADIIGKCYAWELTGEDIFIFGGEEKTLYYKNFNKKI